MRIGNLVSLALVIGVFSYSPAGQCAAPAASPPPPPPAAPAPPPAPPPPAAPSTPPPPPPVPEPPAGGGTSLPHAGSMGIEVNLPAGGNPTLGFTYYLTPHGALRGDLGLKIFSQSGSTQQVSFEGGYRLYFAEFDHFMPFVQPGLWVGNPNSVFTIAPECGIGGEYFVSSHFSFGAQTGVALTLSAPPNANAQAVFATGTTAVFGQFLW